MMGGFGNKMSGQWELGNTFLPALNRGGTFRPTQSSTRDVTDLR